MFDKRITLFIGHFGSGKTEVSVNYALQMAKVKKNVALLDFDIVNPFFRAADAKKVLEDAGIKVILPIYANTNVDVPALTAEANTMFENDTINAVFDVGGDDLGAKAVSRYKEKIVETDHEVLFVVNLNRPMTDTVDKIVQMYNEVVDSAGIKPSGLVNNTHALQYTTSEMIQEAQQIIEKAAKIIGVPVKIVSGMAEYLDKLEPIQGVEFLKMGKCINLPF